MLNNGNGKSDIHSNVLIIEKLSDPVRGRGFYRKLKMVKEVLLYSILLFMCFLILLWVYPPNKINLSIPMGYCKDSLHILVLAKGIIENGWFLNNPSLGAPSVNQMYDFPLTNSLDFVILKVIACFVRDPIIMVHLFYLFSFPLVACTSFFVFRRIGISELLSFCGSLIFAFTPFHFMRNTEHLFYSSYFVVPLVVMVCLWISDGNLRLRVFSKNIFEHGKWKCIGKLSAAIIISILVSSLTIYYAFFSCCFLLTAGGIGSLKKRQKYPALISFLLVILISAGAFANSLPTIIYHAKFGPNPAVAHRFPQESEIYGLKIIQLLLPPLAHRIPCFSSIASLYSKNAPLINENSYSSLGLIGGVGFMMLLLRLLINNYRKKSYKNLLNKLGPLSILNISAVLLGTIGGFGSIFAWLISPQIRGYNRISIFIAFFSILALVIVLQVWVSKRKNSVFLKVLITSVFVLGLWEEIPVISRSSLNAIRKEYDGDRIYFHELELRLKQGAAIFQLPYVPFPESPPVYHMLDYDHFRGYLHSKHLRWSYGAMKGRDGDRWQKEISLLPAEDMVKKLINAGFSGIYIDRYGYHDQAVDLESKLGSILGKNALISANGRYCFYDFASFSENLNDNRNQGF